MPFQEIAVEYHLFAKGNQQPPGLPGRIFDELVGIKYILDVIKWNSGTPVNNGNVRNCVSHVRELRGGACFGTGSHTEAPNCGCG